MNDLLAAAISARDNAHVPYSHFPVGAALRVASGRVFAGANVENAAYPQGQCAEASAIGALVTAGEREIVEVLVVGGGEGLCTPCGGCRQRLAELADPAVPVHLCGSEGLRRTVTLGELLPLAFSGRNLGTRTPMMQDPLEAAVETVAPRIALILGSGLDAVGDAIQPVASFAYSILHGFPQPTVAGHAGSAVVGRLAGVPILLLRGRAHLYEGNPPALIATWIRRLKALGIRTLLLTNAVGSLRADLPPGSLVAISDHINFQGINPLVGPNDETVGPRFPDMSAVYDRAIRAALAAASATVGVTLHEGVFMAFLGPTFETPAEIRAARSLGADIVGMSTVPEAIAAVHAGLRVAAVSVVTNLAAGMQGPLSHAETLAGSRAAADDLARLLCAAIPEIARATA